MVERLYLKNRKRTYRSEYYVNEAFDHPAKMHPEIAQWIIRRYSKKGELILDPMAGIGTTVVESIILGRHAVGIEIQKNWADIIKESCKKQKHSDLFMPGQYGVVNGDSTLDSAFSSFSRHDVKIDATITSPPYGIVMQGGGFATEQRRGGLRTYDHNDGDNPKNIGNFRYGTKSYENSMSTIYKNVLNYTKMYGTMVILTKNFYHKSKYIKLWEYHQKLAESVGWNFLERFEFNLPYITHWQKINRDKYPDRIVVDWEDLIVLKKVA